MQKLTELIREDMKPALGVTEPGAIAFAVASAKKYTEGKIVNVHVALNSGMYKNAFTCGIPNSERFGNYYAAALGAVAADSEKGLESLADITPEDDEKAAQMVSDGLVEVVMDHVGSEIMIDAVVTTENNRCKVMIRDAHTNIVKIEKDGIVIFETEDKMYRDESRKKQARPVIHGYSLAEILRYVNTVPVEEIAFIEKAYTMNLELLKEGLASDRAVFAKKLYRENGNRIISRDALKTAQLLCNGAIEARVLGLSRPAMSITGPCGIAALAERPDRGALLPAADGKSVKNKRWHLRASVCFYHQSSKSPGRMTSSSAAGSATRRRLWWKMAFSSVLRARRPLPAVRASSACRRS